MTPIITIRPDAGCASTIALGTSFGLTIAGHPLFRIAARKWTGPEPDEVDALLLGSANAVEYGGAELARYAAKPVHGVGEATAAAARARGFAVASVGEGGLQAILDALAALGPAGEHRLLRLAGQKHVPLHLPPGVSMATRIVYAAQSLPMGEALAAKLRGAALVLLHSAEAAKHLAGECDRLSVPKERISIAALGPRILAAAGSGWAAARSASQPRDTALLALARDMWQE